LRAELGISPDEAFRLISRYSQNTNQRVRAISSKLVRGRLAATAFREAGER
jgi:ANTAR domain